MRVVGKLGDIHCDHYMIRHQRIYTTLRVPVLEDWDTYPFFDELIFIVEFVDKHMMCNILDMISNHNYVCRVGKMNEVEYEENDYAIIDKEDQNNIVDANDIINEDNMDTMVEEIDDDRFDYVNSNYLDYARIEEYWLQ